MIFEDREEAGRQLARQMAEFADREDVIVLGIPRGGVAVAVAIAQRLRAPLDVFLSRKLGVPGDEELAFGAVAARDAPYLDEEVVRVETVTAEEIERVTREARQTLDRRVLLYRGDRPPLHVAGKTVILLDDGLATGASMYAAVRALRQMRPAAVIVGVPVAPPSTCEWIRRFVVRHEISLRLGSSTGGFLSSATMRSLRCCGWESDAAQDRGVNPATYTHRMFFTKAVNVSVSLCFFAGLLYAAPAKMDRQRDGFILHTDSGDLRIQVLSDTVVRVGFAKSTEFFSRASIDVIPHSAFTTGWKLSDGPAAIVLSTAKLQVSVDRQTGAVSFEDAAGRPILAEASSGRTLEPAEVQAEHTFHVQQRWKAQADESLYGLGQMQLGITDIKGYDIYLWQHNTNIVVPFLVSSQGYGVLWDNTSFSRFGDLRPFEAIPAANLFDANGAPGGLTVAPIDGSEAARRTADIGITRTDLSATGGRPAPLKHQRWEGSILAPTSGDYQFQAYSNGGIQVWLDGKLVMHHWRQNWLPSNDQVRMHLEAGHKYSLRIENDPEQQTTFSFLWKTPPSDAAISLWSQVGEGVDYYFVYGPAMDQVIAGYRFLTGKATMLPNWAFGLWQSRQRYETADQSLDVVRQFRQRQIPFDNIVQDWQYWRADSWGSHQFDVTRFPDPEGWITAIHGQHTHLMISVWGKFNPNTDNAKEMDAKGYLYQPNLTEHIKDWIGQPYTFYDAFNPAARELFWSQINEGLFSKGVDAWWMDATEPDLIPSPPTLGGQQTHMTPTFLGTGSRMLNGYALLNSEGVYMGQRQAAPNQRAFILTRSGFAGEQRYSAVPWSGDITSTWTAMAKQVAAGLGASISGLPYWTMDTGGYTMQQKFSHQPMTAEAQEEWRELNARWFEYATFTPLLRVHGELRPREMWTLGDGSSAFNAELNSDRLRYALFPYIYSLAGWTSQSDYTMMRPLVMDFADDRTARELSDEYMFGPALLVAPVAEYKRRSRPVYLPSGAAWYDYWTGRSVASGNITADTPLEYIPVFVRAGSILPYAPPMQYIGEKPCDPTTLFVYAGASGSFVLYEDQGTTFDYERGAFSQIPIRWDDKAATLTVGRRKGTFSGMLERRIFQVILVSKAHPTAFSQDVASYKTVAYSGAETRVKLQ